MTPVPIDDVRALCLALPSAEERVSHGHPAFFVGPSGRMFAAHLVEREPRGDGPAVWLAAPDGAQEALVDAAPDRFAVPPYVGHRGWIAVRLDGALGRDELQELIADAFVTVAPRRLTDGLRVGD